MARKSRKYEKQSIEAARIALAKMAKSAETDAVQTKKAVGMLKKEIQAARRGGATWSEVVEALHSAGVEVAARTVMEMVNNKGKKEVEKAKVKAPVKPAATKSNVPPVLPPGQFFIKPDRGADL